jgi:heat shock protein HslJ
MFKKILVTFVLFTLLISCNTMKKTEKTIFIGPETKTCFMEMETQCLQVKWLKNQKNWENFGNNIMGFTFEPGFEYELIVKEEVVENPPADAPGLKWTLVKEVSKKKVASVKTNDIKDKRWKLIEFMGNPINENDYYIIFHSKDNSIESKVGCNQLRSNFTISNEYTISVSNFSSTKMLCLKSKLNENDYIKELENVNNFTLSTDGKRLSLNINKMAPIAIYTLEK